MLLCRTDDAILPIPRSAVLVCTCANMKETTKRPMAHISNNSATLKRHGLKKSFLPSSIPTDPIDLPVLIFSPYPTSLPLLWWLCSRGVINLPPPGQVNDLHLARISLSCHPFLPRRGSSYCLL